MAQRILIIDDEPDQIAMIRMRLEAHGYEVISAMDGDEGLKMVRKMKPALVILDFVLPGLDGFVVCMDIRKIPHMEKVPVIMVTASGMKDFDKRCKDVGADVCMRRPFESADLLSAIKGLIGD